MRKILIYTFLLLFPWLVRSQSYHALSVYEDINKKTEFIIQEIDSITFDNYSQKIWLKDSVFSTPISEMSFGSFYPKYMNEAIVNTKDIGDWSEMRVGLNGSMLMIKNEDGKSNPKEIFSIVPNEHGEPLFIHSDLDDIGRPKRIRINDCQILYDSTQDNYANLTIVLQDTLIYSVDSVLITPTDPSLRAMNENNWQRNFLSGLGAASSVLEIGCGALLIASSVVGEFGTIGASTPISIAGIMEGSLLIASGVNSINEAWNTLLIPGEHTSDLGETLYYQAAGTLIGNAPQSPYIPDQYWPYLKEPNNYNVLNRASWALFFTGLTAGVIDNMYGRTVTWEQLRDYYHGKALTGIHKDITPHAATVRGYIYPSITRSLLNGSKNETEYGIVLYSSTDGTDRHIKKEIDGDGGMIEYTFTDLQPETTYYYRTYFIDKTNQLSLLGELKSFMTSSAHTVGEVYLIQAIGQEFGKLNLTAAAIIIEFEDTREGLIGYGFGIFRDGKLVKEYSIEDFNEPVMIELECDTSNLTLDWDNLVATTKGHWTMAKSVRYKSDGKECVSYFSDYMQDIDLIYDEVPELWFSAAIYDVKPFVIEEDENEEPYYCRRHTHVFCEISSLFWGNQIEVVFLEWKGADAINYLEHNKISNMWEPTINQSNPNKLITGTGINFYLYYYYGGLKSCLFSVDLILPNGRRIENRFCVGMYGNDDFDYLDMMISRGE